MTSDTDFPILDETWDTVDRSTLNEKLFRKVWLRCEAYLHTRGYILAHSDSDQYRAIFSDCSTIPTKPPQDPFHPQPDEAFWYMESGVCPLREPSDAGRVLYPTPTVHPALDARGRRVMLKAVRSSSTELIIARLLSTDPLRTDPRNHTIPVLEILDAGEWAIIVTPEWGSDHWEACASVKEYIEFSRQLFEGLAFMHEHGIAHGDIHKLNLVMNHEGQCSTHRHFYDPFPRDFGPCGAKYAFIDFSESYLVRTEEDAMRLPVEMRSHGETAAPELFRDDPVNVFSCDVYALGALLKEHIDISQSLEAQGHSCILLTSPQYAQLIDTITQEDPHRRPTARVALAYFENLLYENDLTKSSTGTSVTRDYPHG